MKLRFEDGTIAPLGIGLAMIALAMILTLASASSLFVYERRLEAVTDQVALQLLQENSVDAVRANALAKTLSTHNFANLRLEPRLAADTMTLEVRACADWQNPLPVIGVALVKTVCAISMSR